MAADADPADGELTEKAATDTEPEAAEHGVDDAEDYDATVGDDADAGSEEAAPAKRSTHVRTATWAGLAMVLALTTAMGWLGFRAYQEHQAQAQRELFLQVGRQCAVNLTTIDWQHAEADVQRLLDSATGKFYDQFSQRKQPFIDLVKKAQSKSVGTVTEAGLTSDSDDKAEALVAVSIKTSNLGATDQPPREWRVRISLEKTDGQVKVSNVSFVS
jgi:Mce-associated membrane protein